MRDWGVMVTDTMTWTLVLPSRSAAFSSRHIGEYSAPSQDSGTRGVAVLSIASLSLDHRETGRKIPILWLMGM